MQRVLTFLRDRRGSTMVLALMVSIFLMVLITATMALTIVDVQTAQDFARNKKTFQAADSGIVHADAVLAEALSGMALPPTTSTTQVAGYAADAETGSTQGNADISLLVAAGPNLDDILPRGETTTQGTLEEESTGLGVGYNAGVNITPTSVDYPTTQDTSDRHVFHYDYEISSQGDADINTVHNEATRRQTGNFDVEVKRPSFSTYGYFTQGAKNQFGQQLWFYDGEVYGGPTHVNSAPPTGQCAFWGQATFNGPFSAVQSRYDQSLFGGNANPIFNGTQSWGVAPIDLPTNGWSQLRASIGDTAHVENATAPTNAELRLLLGLPAGSTAIDKGVYYASSYNNGTSLLGGIFINGNADAIHLDASGSNQIITITTTANDSGQFNGTHTWQFTENKGSGTVSVTYDSGAAQLFNGHLNGLIHTQGQVLNLSGDGGVSTPDVQADQGITISATSDITITDHITYEENPAAYPDTSNILGIFSSGGNVLIARTAPNNLHLDATVMATGSGKGIGAAGIVSGGSYDYNYPNKGMWHLTGGLIEHTNQTTGVFYTNGHVTGYTWDFTYDERFQKGVAPPYFPYVTKFVVTLLGIEARSWGRQYY
jgi:hypothetical protein